MLRQTINILTSYSKPKKICVMGNVAVARGAIEVGVHGVFAYPGTPSTEISEVFNYVNEFQNKEEYQKKYPQQTKHKIYFEYSINEKIALEKAIAYSIGNKRVMCVMKNVGMNVASDALMSITYQTIIAPLVIILCDDPGCFSSSNEQDSRYWGKFASVPILNPATPQDAYEMTKDAFTLSEKLKLPVIVRMSTRIDHSRGVISYNKIDVQKTVVQFERLPQHINIPARTATAHKVLLEKFEHEFFSFLNKKHNTVSGRKEVELGIVASGTATVYVQELLSKNSKTQRIPFLKIGVLHPFPKKDVLNFLQKGFKKILVLEELDPLVEDEIRIIAQKNKIDCEILGKGFSKFLTTGEYTLDIVRTALEEFTGISLQKKNHRLLEGAEKNLANLPPRPPALCAGCPHRATFYALKLAIPRDDGKIIMCGDIGCFGLGALPPLQMIDTINHMGMSVSMAQGLSEAMHLKPSQGKIVAMLGDGTFFHSGVASLINAIYTRSNITVIIFDNRTIGMTGHQDHPGATHLSKYRQIDILQLVKGLGVEYAESVNPFNLKDTYAKIKNAIAHNGVSMLIAKAPCVFLPEFKDGVFIKKSLRVDPNKCNTCFNHCDMSLSCSKEQSGKNSLVRAKAKITATEHIFGSEQLCPANICNHGFFNSILWRNYKEALEIVRDKMLFAGVCGDICHKPCENLFRGTEDEGRRMVPIKKLKNFVSGIEDNFNDFSKQISRAKNAKRKNKKVAVIGAGAAGLSAAYDLVQTGYDVTVFEKESASGGMVRFVIPDFRMDKSGMDKEMSVLKKMGVQFRFNISLGKEITIKNLSADYDAVIVAIGMWNSPALDVVEKNVQEHKKSGAISFLKKFNQKNLKLKSDSTVLVIGGGNSAMDAARAAKKINKKNTVFISCIETIDKMPAFAEEIANAVEEGIEIIDNSFADSISEKNGKYLVALKSFDKKSLVKNLNIDFIITAIGQRSEHLGDKSETDENGRIKKFNFKNVFAAGDIASGNHISLIGAIGSGKRAAVQVRKLLENYEHEYEGEVALNKIAAVSSNSSRQSNTEQTLNFELETLNYFNLFQPCAKCDHCIENFGCPAMVKVNGKIVIDDLRCTRCGLCIDVCPNGAIEWVEEKVTTV